MLNRWMLILAISVVSAFAVGSFGHFSAPDQAAPAASLSTDYQSTELAISTMPTKEAGFEVCNQGAFCTFRNDPACGPEGFCNLSSNCCMCW